MIIESEVAIASCPMCGGEAALHENPVKSFSAKEGFWVKYTDLQCGCTMLAQQFPEEAVDRWNRRAV